MHTIEKQEALVSDLMIILQDRYEGYQKAAGETKDPGLEELFKKLSHQSLQFRNELKGLYTHGVPESANRTLVAGKLYRLWMDIKAGVSLHNPKVILSSCEYGEDMVMKAYKDVLAEPEELSPDALHLLMKQQQVLKQSHDFIKKLRDAAN